MSRLLLVASLGLVACGNSVSSGSGGGQSSNGNGGGSSTQAGTSTNTNTGGGSNTGTNVGGSSNTTTTGMNTGGAGVGGMGSSTGGSGTGGSGGSGGSPEDPTTCAEAATKKTNVGCDFWPTINANIVWSIFDFAVAVANPGTVAADVTVEQGGMTISSATVPPGDLQVLYLPWITTLKGPDADTCVEFAAISNSVAAMGGAFHLTSTAPIAAYQFSPLESQGVGGPPGKDWSTCPGNQVCTQEGTAMGCFSFTNDASLLLPTTALTGNYRVTSHESWSSNGVAIAGPVFTITGTEAATSVTVKVPKGADILGGGSITAMTGPATFTLSLDAGDVVEIVGSTTSDLGGTLVKASHPVEVIASMPCLTEPSSAQACDHVEETVLPAETLGKVYVVAPPTGPNGDVVGQQVKLFGHVDGTVLAYPAGQPAGAPLSIDAGKVVDLGIQTAPFVVTGNHAFAIATFLQSASIVDPSHGPPNQMGDPSQTVVIPVEQFRTTYDFLAPTDYAKSFLDVTAPSGTTFKLDGVAAFGDATIIGEYTVTRLTLGTGQNGAHRLVASAPVGAQVLGYGSYSSYEYPAGALLTPLP